MNIEQAKALKVGGDIILNSDWDDMTVGKSYPITRAGGSVISFIDDVGDTRNWKFEFAIADFDLVTTKTPTQWIPFDKERMSEAEGYRSQIFKSPITDVYINDGDKKCLVCMYEGELNIFSRRDIEMLVPVVVKYPCLCRNAAGFEISLMPEHHVGWTPLTTTELAEIGLKQIS